MTTIKFLQPCGVKDHRAGTAHAETYAAGQIVTLTDPSAQHWVSRGKAVICELPAPPPPTPRPVPPPPLPPAVTEAEVEEPRAEMEPPAEETPSWRGRPDRRTRR